MGFSSPHTNNEQESCHKAGQNTTHAYNHQDDKFPDWTEANVFAKLDPDAEKNFYLPSVVIDRKSDSFFYCHHICDFMTSFPNNIDQSNSKYMI
jgi:predicted CxxxxCH...CXXCH cytochrome family protein